MIIRQLETSDLDRIQKLHHKFYEEEYQFTKLFDNLLGSFIIESGNEIVCAGGVKTIAESILITNKDLELNIKLEGLNHALQINEFIARKSGFDQIHAFIKDDVAWRAWLKKAGFIKCNGSAYYLGVK